MTFMPEGKALVYCEREYLTANGKTAHGLVRHTVRYDIVGVVDSKVHPVTQDKYWMETLEAFHYFQI